MEILEFALQLLRIAPSPPNSAPKSLEPAELSAVYGVDGLTEKITSLPTGAEEGKLTALSGSGLPPTRCGI